MKKKTPKNQSSSKSGADKSVRSNDAQARENMSKMTMKK